MTIRSHELRYLAADFVCNIDNPTHAARLRGVVLNALEKAADAIEALERSSVSSASIVPVQGYPPGIPLGLHLEAVAAYVARGGRERGLLDPAAGYRGGFHVAELDQFLPYWRKRLAP